MTALFCLWVGGLGLIGCDDTDSARDSSEEAGELSEESSGEQAGEQAGDQAGEVDEDMGMPEPDAEPPYEHPEYAQEMLELVNAFRAEGGTCGRDALPSVPPLALQRQLNEAARDHAADMAAKGYFDHNSPDGRTPSDRMQARGYRGSAYGENIAAGNESAYDTFIQWKNSPGHCSNMLNSSYSELGVGYVRAPFSNLNHFWVQNFGHP